MHISELVAASSPYRTTEIEDVAVAGGLLTHLVVGRGQKPKLDAAAGEMGQHICPYCTEAIPESHLGDVADWSIVGNKYAGTDREVLAVSKEHTPNLNRNDFRTWVDIAQQTEGLVIYSPARKSVPSHKHVPIFDYPESPLLSASTTRVDDDVSLTKDYPYKSIVIDGDDDARLQKTLDILDRLYAREHMHDVAISEDRTFILPSKVIGRMLGNRIFIGVASTESRDFFEYVKLPENERDGSFTIPDYSDCNYSDEELLNLTLPDVIQYPTEDYVKRCLGNISIGSVLSLGHSNGKIARHIAHVIDAEAQETSFYFTTDKKRNFLPDCLPPELNEVVGRGLLVIVGSATSNIREYVTRLRQSYGASHAVIAEPTTAGELILSDLDTTNSHVPAARKATNDNSQRGR